MDNVELLRVPENLTVMLPANDENGKYYLDAAEGFACYYAIGEFEMRHRLYVIDCFGFGEFEKDFETIPAIHCKRCGQKMCVDDTREISRGGQKFAPVGRATRRCYCGASYNPQTGWEIPTSDFARDGGEMRCNRTRFT